MDIWRRIRKTLTDKIGVIKMYANDFIKIVKEGDMIPFWYGKIGFCFDRPHNADMQVAIIPLNYLVKFWYWILRKSRPSKWEGKIYEALKEAYRIGYEQGKFDFLKFERISEDISVAIQEIVDKLKGQKK